MVTETLTYDPAATFDVRWQDIEYRRDETGAYQARVHQPQGAGPFPTLVSIHGGAWNNQDRTQNAEIDGIIAASGILVVAIDFRNAPQAPYPASLVDINYGVRWLKAHASDFGGSAEGLGGIGFSSGGHTVMLGAMRPRDSRYAAVRLDEAPTLDASLAYVIMGWPVIDPLGRYELARGRQNAELMGNHTRMFGDEAGMIEASPPHILQRGESVELPPALLVQGAADDNLPEGGAEEFARLYGRAGGVIELAKYPGEPHGFLRQPGPNSSRCMEVVKSFIARQLRRGPRAGRLQSIPRAFHSGPTSA